MLCTLQTLSLLGNFFFNFLGPFVDLCARCWASFDVLSHWDHQSTNNDVEIIINLHDLRKGLFHLALIALLIHISSSTFCHMTGYLFSVLHILLHLVSNSIFLLPSLHPEVSPIPPPSYSSSNLLLHQSQQYIFTWCTNIPQQGRATPELETRKPAP